MNYYVLTVNYHHQNDDITKPCEYTCVLVGEDGQMYKKAFGTNLPDLSCSLLEVARAKPDCGAAYNRSDCIPWTTTPFPKSLKLKLAALFAELHIDGPRVVNRDVHKATYRKKILVNAIWYDKSTPAGDLIAFVEGVPAVFRSDGCFVVYNRTKTIKTRVPHGTWLLKTVGLVVPQFSTAGKHEFDTYYEKVNENNNSAS